VKKCASCTKDLPDAALHCVFCGAKQPPAPAVQQQGLAKTAFGYSANDVLEQVRGRPLPPAAPAYQPPQPAYQPPQPAYQPPQPYQQRPPGTPPMQVAPTMPAPPARTPLSPAVPPPVSQPLGQPYTAGPQGGYVPSSPASAKTMFVQSGPPGPMPPAPTSGYPPPSPAANAPTLVPPPPQMLTMPAPAPGRQPPAMAIPAAQPPPYFASQTGSRLIRPFEPWRDGLRAWMFLWGLALIAAFATPIATSPDLVFAWKQILEGAGTARLPPLLPAAVGVLGVILAILPMPTAPRGVIATLLGLAGIAVPIALGGLPHWLVLVHLIGLLLLVPSLLVRDEYRDALTARLLVTVGAIAVLLPFGLPQNDAIPLVAVIKSVIDLPGTQKIKPALDLGLVTIVVMSLLAWLPAPATGAAKTWAWLLILWALIVHIIDLVVAGGIGGAITGAPNATLVSWVVGAPGAIGSAYLALVGYGLASVIGKQLE
jgi:hypothetical protein